MSNIYEYCVGNILYLLDKMGILPSYLKEQVLLRFASCSCTREAKCCGCKVPNVFYAPKACSLGKYPKLQSLLNWKKNRILYNKSIVTRNKFYDYFNKSVTDGVGITWEHDLWKGWYFVASDEVPVEVVWAMHIEDYETVLDFTFAKVASVEENANHILPEMFIDINDDSKLG